MLNNCLMNCSLEAETDEDACQLLIQTSNTLDVNHEEIERIWENSRTSKAEGVWYMDEYRTWGIVGFRGVLNTLVVSYTERYGGDSI
jgi:hypothetical protein